MCSSLPGLESVMTLVQPLSQCASTIVTLFCLPHRRRSLTSCSMFKILQHVWSQGPGSTSVVCLGWCMMTCTNWLFLRKCSTRLLWQSIVAFAIEIHGTSPTTVCQSPKFLVTSICDLADIVNCQFHEFAAALWDPCIFVTGPTVWNSLLDHLCDPAVDFKQLRRDLKTYLFAGHLKR